MIRRLFSLPAFTDEEQSHRVQALHFILWSMLLIVDTQFFVFFFLLPQNWPRWLAIILIAGMKRRMFRGRPGDDWFRDNFWASRCDYAAAGYIGFA